jgi:hypothetical protein
MSKLELSLNDMALFFETALGDFEVFVVEQESIGHRDCSRNDETAHQANLDDYNSTNDIHLSS